MGTDGEKSSSGRGSSINKGLGVEVLGLGDIGEKYKMKLGG